MGLALPQVIEHVYLKRFRRERPAVVVSTKQRARRVQMKTAERKAETAERKAARAARRVEATVGDGPS